MFLSAIVITSFITTMESLSKYHFRSSHKFEHNTVPPSGFSVQPVFPLGVELVLPRGLGVELGAVLLPGGPRGLLSLLPPGLDLKKVEYNILSGKIWINMSLKVNRSMALFICVQVCSPLRGPARP